MHIQVTGKQIDVGAALRGHVEESFSESISKYSENPIDAIVLFSRRGHEFTCDASAHLSTGLTAKASAHAHDVYAAADACCERLEKQLRRYKRRLKDHHQARQDPIELMEAQSYVLRSHDEEADGEGPNGMQPVIVAEMTTGIKSLSVGEAVMQMELDHAPFLMFRNDANGRINVVFQRDDGNVGWIDPANLPEG